MPKQSKSQRENRRNEILRCCVECFAKKGFHQTSMRDLCKELNVSLGSLYTYFKTKEEMVKAFIERDRAQAKIIFDSVTPDMTFWQGIERMVEINNMAMALPSAKKSCILWVQINAEAMINPKVRKLVTEYYQHAAARLTELIKGGQARGELKEDFDPAALAWNLIAVSDGLALWGMLNPKKDPQSHLSLFLKLLRDSLEEKTIPLNTKPRGRTL
jgi:TetR/AcrR family transcriptional regulator, repressor for uid operon